MILNRKGRNTLAWSQHPFPTNHPLFMEKQCNWIRTIPKFTPYYRMTQILTEFSIHNHNIQSHPSSQMFDLKWFRNQRAGRKQGPDGRSTLVCTWPPCPPPKKSLFIIKKRQRSPQFGHILTTKLIIIIIFILFLNLVFQMRSAFGKPWAWDLLELL